jgi:hypothetical protein
MDAIKVGESVTLTANSKKGNWVLPCDATTFSVEGSAPNELIVTGSASGKSVYSFVSGEIQEDFEVEVLPLESLIKTGIEPLEVNRLDECFADNKATKKDAEVQNKLAAEAQAELDKQKEDK